MLESQKDLSVADYKKIRRFAVQFLYQQDMNGQFYFLESDFQTFLSQCEVEELQKKFLRRVISLVFENIKNIDSLIEKKSTHWKMFRISKVDLAILRVGVLEILERKDTDVPVLISDAAGIAKEFGTANSSGFVNGILDAIAKEIRT
jgi:N utilization substance protein B